MLCILETENVVYEICMYLGWRDIRRFAGSSRGIWTICQTSPLVRRVIVEKMTDEWIREEGWKERAFISSVWSGNFDVFDELLKRGVDPTAYQNEAIVMASERGLIEFVNRLLGYPGVDPSVRSNVAFVLALQRRHVQVARRLIRDQRVAACVPDFGSSTRKRKLVMT